jgi:hypothetical protein
MSCFAYRKTMPHPFVVTISEECGNATLIEFPSTKVADAYSRTLLCDSMLHTYHVVHWGTSRLLSDYSVDSVQIIVNPIILPAQIRQSDSQLSFLTSFSRSIASFPNLGEVFYWSSFRSMVNYSLLVPFLGYPS